MFQTSGAEEASASIASSSVEDSTAVKSRERKRHLEEKHKNGEENPPSLDNVEQPLTRRQKWGFEWDTRGRRGSPQGVDPLKAGDQGDRGDQGEPHPTLSSLTSIASADQSHQDRR